MITGVNDTQKIKQYIEHLKWCEENKVDIKPSDIFESKKRDKKR